MKSISVRFSLATLMSVVAVAAFIVAALRFASAFWASAAFTLSVAVLLFSLLAVVFRRDASRAFWVGYLLFGWAYLAIVFGPWFSSNVRDHLLTSKILGYTHNKIASLHANEGGLGAVASDIDHDGWADLLKQQVAGAPPEQQSRWELLLRHAATVHPESPATDWEVTVQEVESQSGISFLANEFSEAFDAAVLDRCAAVEWRALASAAPADLVAWAHWPVSVV